VAKPIFDEAVFREAITRWEVNADRASAERILAGVGVVLRMLDKARADAAGAREQAAADLEAHSKELMAAAIEQVTKDDPDGFSAVLRASAIGSAVTYLRAKTEADR
jgi:hypothetical protein